MKRKPKLTTDFILSRLVVDIETGECIWLNGPRVGRQAGYRSVLANGKPYWLVHLGSTAYLRSHIVFAVANKRWPTKFLDHKDRNTLNDAASNLREATKQQNAWNTVSKRRSQALPMGVRRIGTPSERYEARIYVDSKLISLGYFSSVADAEQTYLAKKREIAGEYCP